MTYLDYPILPLTGGIAYGATTQDGIPTPSAPVPLVNAIEAGAYRYARDGGNYQVTLPAMRGIGDVRDTWDAETGTFTQRVGELVLTGGVSATNGETYISIMFEQISPAPSAYGAALCTHLPKAGNLTSFGFRPASKSIAFNLAGQSAYSDATTFVSWLAAQYAAGTPVIVYYQLATPVVSTITPELMYADPVYDHTAMDYLNASDLNRIETATAFLRDVLEGYGYSITLVTKTDWQVGDWPTVAQFARIRGNINALQAGFYTLPDWREIARRYLPSGEEATDYDILNAEEWDLHALGVWVERMVASFWYSGEIYAGEV